MADFWGKADVAPRCSHVANGPKADSFELVLSIKALVARALADEVIEGRDVTLRL